jgi:hypothetical protein
MADYDKAPYRFSMTSSLEWYSNGELAGAMNGGSSISVNIAGWPKIYIQVTSWLHAVFYSASSINYLAPALVGSIAAVVLTGKVFFAYLST